MSRLTKGSPLETVFSFQGDEAEEIIRTFYVERDDRRRGWVNWDTIGEAMADLIRHDCGDGAEEEPYGPADGEVVREHITDGYVLQWEDGHYGFTHVTLYRIVS